MGKKINNNHDVTGAILKAVNRERERERSKKRSRQRVRDRYIVNMNYLVKQFFIASTS